MRFVVTEKEKKMSKEKQIEEMARVLKFCRDTSIDECHTKIDCKHCVAEQLYDAGYRKQIEGEWLEEPFESMIPATFDEEGRLVIHQYIAYRCSICGRNEHVKEPYCNCGAKMKGGE